MSGNKCSTTWWLLRLIEEVLCWIKLCSSNHKLEKVPQELKRKINVSQRNLTMYTMVYKKWLHITRSTWTAVSLVHSDETSKKIVFIQLQQSQILLGKVVASLHLGLQFCSSCRLMSSTACGKKTTLDKDLIFAQVCMAMTLTMHKKFHVNISITSLL